jgi:hypothetical protein
VVRNELNSPTLLWLSDKERWDKLVDVITEIKLLTGAIIHEGEALQLQLKVIERFLISSKRYAALTTNEILHAFYLNNQGEFGTVYRHYNRELNAEFVGDVLLAYLNYKDGIYARVNIKGLLDPAPERKPLDPITDIALMGYIQGDYDMYRSDARELIFHSPFKYNLLRRAGLIEVYSRKYWRKMEAYAMAERVEYGSGRPERATDVREREDRAAVASMYARFVQDGYLPIAEYRLVVQGVRRRLYMRFFEMIASCGINDIFFDIKHNLREQYVLHKEHLGDSAKGGH